MKRFKHMLVSVFVLVLMLPTTVVAQSFRVSDIRVEGLQRVSAGTVFAALPVQIGDRMDSIAIQKATRALFRSGYFADIQIGREGGVLIISVKERPSISEISIEGNKAIKTEDLMKGLKENGLSEGQIFKRATLEGLTQELQRQYVAQGRYGAAVETKVQQLPRNQIKLEIDVDEGQVAAIKHINIVGNSVYSDEELFDLFELKTSGWLSWLNNNDKYSREKLSGDIERLESYYLDRGYLRFNIDSTQVSLSPDKESVFITINVTEGGIYTISSVELAGDPVVGEDQVRRLILLGEGSTFSQVLMTTTSEYITKRLGNEGYTFAKVRGIPELDDKDKTVKVTFFIDPGKRAYVRRVEFRGNTKTSDNVLRREMRQMESASASTARIEHSKVRLERLGFFKEVTVDTVEVPGTSDQIDVEYAVEEQPSGSIGASFGYSESSGLVLGANVKQSNWFGTGKQVGFSVSNSDFQTVYSFSYTDPYYTPDGVSRGFNLFFQERDFKRINVTSYNTDTYGASVSFGYPISEVERLGLSLGYSNLLIKTGPFAVQEIVSSPRLNPNIIYAVDETIYNTTCLDSSGVQQACDLSAVRQLTSDLSDTVLNKNPAGFIDQNGDNFDSYTFTLSWAKSTLNRGQLATRGSSQRMSLEVALPGGELEYYKFIYTGQYFRPLTKNLTLRLRTELGWGDAYGDTSELPFFEHFYAGGFGSVRGFKRNTLGPQSSPALIYNGSVSSVITDTGSGLAGSDSAYLIGSDGKIGTRIVDADDNPFGGNVLIEASAEVLFPLPFVKDQRSLQSAFFIDAGNVFDTNCGEFQRKCFDVDLSKISIAAGIGVTWITGFGPLTFSIAKDIKMNEGDKPKFFQFSLGTNF